MTASPFDQQHTPIKGHLKVAVETKKLHTKNTFLTFPLPKVLWEHFDHVICVYDMQHVNIQGLVAASSKELNSCYPSLAKMQRRKKGSSNDKHNLHSRIFVVETAHKMG